MEDAWIAKATERIFLAPIKLTLLPEITNMDMPFVGVAHNLVLASIEKTYSGQGIKSMNALWGAGQMMFNKILAVVDGDVDVHDYLKVAQAMSIHVNPAHDIHIGKGPMDVLDHASRKFAYGGKLFIDATRKTDEERNPAANYMDTVDTGALKRVFPSIVDVNNALLKVQVSVVFVSVRKEEGATVDQLLRSIAASKLCTVKCLVAVDANVEVQDLETTLWVAMNNIDPARDVVVNSENNMLLVDATRKTAADNFERQWPNAVVMGQATIDSIDQKWESMGLGKLVQSPSRKYSRLMWNDGATAL
jgi:4-hydroxy-3-polyprenylbenzoate decarboxylase